MSTIKLLCYDSAITPSNGSQPIGFSPGIIAIESTFEKALSTLKTKLGYDTPDDGYYFLHVETGHISFNMGDETGTTDFFVACFTMEKFTPPPHS
jgi:hypothetical protein